MNLTIYFRKDVWDNFQNEKGRSNLVNQLLAAHYGLDPRAVTVSDEPLKTIKTVEEALAAVLPNKPTTKKKGLCPEHNCDKSICGRMFHKDPRNNS